MSNKKVKLSFCEINQINDSVVEVFPFPGIEIGDLELKEYHHFYNQLDHPVGVLVNRMNHYSYSFSALMNITKNKNMVAVAILVLGPVQEHESECIASIAEGDVTIQIFYDRQEALNWLEHKNTQS